MARMTVTTCPTCGSERRIRVADVGRAKQCQRCHLTQIARRGYAATRDKYGQHFAVRFVRDYRLANPSSLEQIVTNWLEEAGIYFEGEYWFETGGGDVFLVDFMLPGCIAVEVNGAWAHSYHVERDRRKLAALRESGFQVVVLSEADIHSGAFVHRLAGAVH